MTRKNIGKVIISEDRKDAHIYDPETMEKETIGQLVSRIYEGERVQRHSFIPAEDNPTGKKEFSLGPTTTAFNFIDHTEAMDPLIENGYTIKKQMKGRGGLTLFSILEPEDPIILKDPIKWDRRLFEDVKGTRQLTISLILQTSIKPGKGLLYQRGLYRQVCTNGLVSQIMSFGRLRFTHSNFNADLVHDAFAEGTKPSQKAIMGPYIGTNNGVHRFAQMLTRHTEGEDQIDSEVPFYIESSLSPILRMPKWFRWSLIEQLMLFHEEGPSKFYALDLLNALSSPIFTDTEDRAVLRPLGRLESLTKGCAQFIGMMSL